MLKLRDFTHLPLLNAQLDKVLQTSQGLVLIAGFSPAKTAESMRDLSPLSSGRGVILNILANEYLIKNSTARAIFVTRDRKEPRRQKMFDKSVVNAHVTNKKPYPFILRAAASSKPDLIVLDELLPENMQAAMEIACSGNLVFSQFDTLLRGSEIIQQLIEFQLDPISLQGLAWIITVQRHPALCPSCRSHDEHFTGKLDLLRHRINNFDKKLSAYFQDQDYDLSSKFYTQVGCLQCGNSGRLGEVAVFDVYRHDQRSRFSQMDASELTREEYLLGLAIEGLIPLDNVLTIDADQRKNIYQVLVKSDASLSESNLTLRRRLVELETANLVLKQRTDQLISLENISKKLILSEDLFDLGAHVSRQIKSLIGGEYIILYQVSPRKRIGIELEILAVQGWRKELIGHRFVWTDAARFKSLTNTKVLTEMPPGIQSDELRHIDINVVSDLKYGLLIPMQYQNELLGLISIQSSIKEKINPGEIALLNTFANQVALAIQRERLTRMRIEKEKIDTELDLARQLQQSLLPQQFPQIPGYRFSAFNRPARWVGGDFYDVFWLDDHHIGLVIGDASDKGIPAALYMALTRSLIQSEAHRSFSTEKILREVNNQLLELGQLRGYITVFFGILDCQNNKLIYSRAGHDRPYVYRAGRLIPLSGEGMMLGMFFDSEFFVSEDYFEFQNGDRLLLYTDGLADVTNQYGKLLPMIEFEQILLSCFETNSDMIFCDELVSKLDRYRGFAEQFDDMTILAISLNAQPAESS